MISWRITSALLPAVAAACVLLRLGGSLALPSSESVRLDPLTSSERLQIAPQSMSGRSALAVTAQDPPEGADRSVELVADFTAPETEWVCIDWQGPSVAGRCRRLAMKVWSEGEAPTLRWTIQDANARWFEREVTLEGRAGWQEAAVGIEQVSDWHPLLRRGEAFRPIEHPIVLRRIGVKRPQGSTRREPRPPGPVRLRFSDLRAETDIEPFDLLDARIRPARPGAVFTIGQTPEFTWSAVNRSRRVLNIRCRADVTGMTGPPRSFDLGSHRVPVDGVASAVLRCPVALYGPYEVTITAEEGARKRSWHTRFAYVRSSSVPGRGDLRSSRFGVCGNVGGIRQDLRSIAARLNRVGGAGWARIGLSWQQVNPARNIWCWDPPRLVESPIGSALRTSGRSYRAAHDPAQDCPDEVTLAFWARIGEANGSHQVAVRKWGSGDRRNYGAYFHRDTGAFCFSAGYQRMPGTVADFSAGTNAFDGQWHHYAATYSRYISSVCLYVDGALRTSARHDGGKLRATSADLVIGQDLAGDVDEVMVYRRALGPADIAALARRAAPPKDGLAAWYAFDDAARPGRNSTEAGATGKLDLRPVEPDAILSAREASAQRMATLGILGFPPAWAATGGSTGRFWLRPPELGVWTRYVENVAGEYRDTIAHWEIWNEPNAPAFWEIEPDPEQYLELLKAAYRAAKRGNPKCTVVMPGLRGPSGPGDHGSRAYLDRLLALGAGRHCDAISVHPYRSGSPEETGLVEDLQWIARRCAVSGVKRPIWITEMGWPTDVPNGVTPRTQAAMLARSYLLAASTRLVDRFFWFRLHDSGPDRTYAEDNYGLCDEAMTPKPAFFAHRTIAVLLGDAGPDGEISAEPRLKALRFRSPSERFAAVWRTSGSEWLAMNVGKSRVVLTDLMGNSGFASAHDGVLLLEADDLPKFVRGLPERVTVTSGLIRQATSTSVGTVALRIRNPYPKPTSVKLKLTARGAALGPFPSAVSIAGLGSATVTVRLSPAPSAPGAARLTVHAGYPGGTATLSLVQSSKGDFVPLSGAASTGDK